MRNNFLFGSKLDIHVMQYCLAINSHSNQNTFCGAIDHVMGKSPKSFCSYFKALNNYYIRPADRILDIGIYILFWLLISDFCVW